jgi:L-ribulose-5-phosphate 4-epimerase
VSSFQKLREASYEFNMEVSRRGLALYTFGNVSVLEPEQKVFAIKPSGVPYKDLEPGKMVIVDLGCRVVEGALRPSSDTRTHAVLYREFPGLGGIVHTHSTHAVGWAQALRPIPCWGTTHADHTVRDIPCTPPMEDARIQGDYEEETGNQIVAHFRGLGLDPAEVQMVLVGCHGPFAWGKTGEEAVYNAVVLEELARMALFTHLVNSGTPPMKDTLKRKHFDRKHGSGAYYGQNK